MATFSRLYVKQHFDCIVFLYRPDVDTTKLGFAPHCQLIKRSGMVFSYWKMVNPMFLARSNYSGVVWHSEDIR